MNTPLAVDLCCGLGGWSDGLLGAGYFTVGFDIEQHVYGDHCYPGNLVVQDIRTIHGSQLKDAAVIVASPPCQEFSYMAMPWSRGKQIARALRGEDEFPDGYRGSRTIGELTALFDACFRIQREACEAAGRYIPLIVENVKGAQPWVGKAKWNYGSFYLWGDVPALMPITLGREVMKAGIAHRSNGATNFHGHKNSGGSWFNVAHNTTSGKGQNPDGRKTNGAPHIRDGEAHTKHLTNPSEHDGIKCGGDWFNASQPSISRQTSSKSPARKAASAMIAKIPLPLSRHIAQVFKP